jgi:hypothetical protein
MRTISSNARAALYAAQSDEVWLQLLTIEHDDIGAPIRLVDNTEPVTSRGDTYLSFPFMIALPASAQETVELTVDNVSRELIEEVRSIATPLSITLEVVTASDPDTVEAGPFEFQSRAVEYDVQAMRFTLAFEPLLSEPFPAYTYTPLDYPGLFQAVDR